MSRLEQQLKKATENIRMNKAERSSLHLKIEELTSYTYSTPIRSSFTDAWFVFKKIGLASSFIVLLVITGGLSAVADNSLPGQLLYPLKTDVIERIRDIFIVSTEHQAEREIDKIERRIEEAARLASLGELTPENKAVLTSKIGLHEQRALELAGKLRKNNNIAAALDIETDVAVHSQAKRIAFLEESSIAMVDQYTFDQSNAVSLKVPEIMMVEEDLDTSYDQRDLRVQDAGIASDDDLSRTSALSVEPPMTANMLQDVANIDESGIEETDYRQAARRQKQSVEKVYAEIRLLVNLSSRGAPAFVDLYNENVLKPLNDLKSLLDQAEEEYSDEKYQISFDIYTQAHIKAASLLTSIKNGSWAKEGTATSTGTSTSQKLPDSDQGMNTVNTVDASIGDLDIEL